MQSHPNQQYYNPLPASHIRLFILPSKEFSQSIEGSLVDVSIDDCGDKVKYNALSYTWGDATQTTHIRLAIGKRVGYLRVTQSVVEALQYARHEQYELGFWVDQICIDQNNAEEKESQIQLMKLIYERAGSVFAWIGPSKEEEGSDLAMDVLSSENWRQMLLPKSPVPSNTHADKEGIDSADGFEANVPGRHEILAAIVKLLRRPWWKRTWIVQEATAQVPTQTLICCGRKQLELSRFFVFLTAVQQQQLHLSPTLKKELNKLYECKYLPKLMAFGSKRQKFPLRPFLESLENARDMEATDSRDKIYVMIPFACDAVQAAHGFRANYKQLPEEAYVEFTLWHIQQSQCLDILSHCSLGGNLFTDTISDGRLLTTVGANNPSRLASGMAAREWHNPSWSPDWRMVLSVEPFPKREIPDDPSSPSLFNASRKVRSPFKVPEPGRATITKLKVRGRKIARVKFVQDQQPSENSIWEPVDSDYRCPLTNLSMQETYVRTVYTDLKAYETENQGMAWRRAEGVQELPWPISPDRTEGGNVPDIVVMRRHTGGRRLYYTDVGTTSNAYGLFGLGPVQTQTDDELWILEGASVPFILRPRTIEYNTNNPTLDLQSGTMEIKSYKGGEDQVFQIVGETFVLGLMDGLVTETADIMMELKDLGKENQRDVRTAGEAAAAQTGSSAHDELIAIDTLINITSKMHELLIRTRAAAKRLTSGKLFSDLQLWVSQNMELRPREITLT